MKEAPEQKRRRFFHGFFDGKGVHTDDKAIPNLPHGADGGAASVAWAVSCGGNGRFAPDEDRAGMVGYIQRIQRRRVRGCK